MSIHQALVAALGEITNPVKDRTANAGPYSYRYADLATVIDHVRPVLSRHELAVTQEVRVEEGRLEVWTYLHHSSGELLTYGPIVGRAGGDWQQLGGAITYARRYALGAALGIAPEDDDDAAGTAKTQPKKAEKPKQPRISHSDQTIPEDDPWMIPLDPETGEAASEMGAPVALVKHTLGATVIEKPLPGDSLRGPAKRSYDNGRKGVSPAQKEIIVEKMKKNFDDVVDEDSALFRAATYLVETGDAEPGEINDWSDWTRRMIDRIFELKGR